MRRLAIVILVIQMLMLLGAPSAKANNFEEVNQFFANLTDALNAQDLDRVTASWFDDGELFTLAGGIIKGRDNIRQSFIEAFNGPFKNAKYQYLVQYVRFNGKTATVDGIWKTQNGPANYPSCGIFLGNLIKKDGHWKIQLSYSTVPKTGHTSEIGRTLSWTKICSSPN